MEGALQSLVPVLDLDVFHDIGHAAVVQLETQPLTEGLFLGTFLQGGETGTSRHLVGQHSGEGEVLGRVFGQRKEIGKNIFSIKGQKEEWLQRRRGLG